MHYLIIVALLCAYFKIINQYEPIDVEVVNNSVLFSVLMIT